MCDMSTQWVSGHYLSFFILFTDFDKFTFSNKIRKSKIFSEPLSFFFFLNIFYLLFIYYFCFWLRWVFVSVRGLSPLAARVGATLHRGAQASHYRGLSCCGAQAPDAQAQ